MLLHVWFAAQSPFPLHGVGVEVESVSPWQPKPQNDIPQIRAKNTPPIFMTGCSSTARANREGRGLFELAGTPTSCRWHTLAQLTRRIAHGGPPRYTCVAHLYFASLEDYYAALEAHGEELGEDVPNYTNAELEIIVSEIIVS